MNNTLDTSKIVKFGHDVKDHKSKPIKRPKSNLRTESEVSGDVSQPGATSDGGTSYAIQQWKPKSETTYETLTLVKTQFNCKIRGAGFRKNGKMRHIKKTCLLAKIKTRCRIRKKNPALAVCITMYNEDSNELKNTLRGLIHNYNCFRADPNFSLTKDDFLIFVVCDGYDRIPDDFKELAREKGFLDEQTLIEKGFMEVNRDGKYKFKAMEDVMDKKVKPEDMPQNLLHVF